MGRLFLELCQKGVHPYTLLQKRLYTPFPSLFAINYRVLVLKCLRSLRRLLILT